MHCKSLKSFFAGSHYQVLVTAWPMGCWVPAAGWELDDNLSPGGTSALSLCYAVPPEEDGGKISWWISCGLSCLPASFSGHCCRLRTAPAQCSKNGGVLLQVLHVCVHLYISNSKIRWPKTITAPQGPQQRLPKSLVSLPSVTWINGFGCDHLTSSTL